MPTVMTAATVTYAVAVGMGVLVSSPNSVRDVPAATVSYVSEPTTESRSHGSAMPRLLLSEITPTRIATAGATVNTAAAEMVLRIVCLGIPSSLARATARHRKNTDCASTNKIMMATSTNKIGAFTSNAIHTPPFSFGINALLFQSLSASLTLCSNKCKEKFLYGEHLFLDCVQSVDTETATSRKKSLCFACPMLCFEI